MRTCDRHPWDSVGAKEVSGNISIWNEGNSGWDNEAKLELDLCPKCFTELKTLVSRFKEKLPQAAERA